MKKSIISMFALAAMGFVLLTGFHGSCGKDTPEARAVKVNRIATAKVDDFLDDLDATDAQRKRVHQIKEGIVADVLPLIEDHHTIKIELRNEWNQDKPDAAKIHTMLDERIDAVRLVLHKVADGAIEVHQLLTPTQRAEVAKRWK